MPEEKPLQISLDISTKNAVESYQIDALFTGKVILNFNQGGLATVIKEENVRKVKQLK